MRSVKPKILLLHPRPTPGDSCTVPYSCLAVAAPLVQHGFEVEILDEFSTPNYAARLRSAAAQTDVVGVSCFTGHQIESSIKSAALLRQYRPDLPIVWGGYHPSLYPSQTVKSDLAEYVVARQGEWIFLDFVERIANGMPEQETPGLWRKVDGVPVQNAGRPEFRGIESFPEYPFHLVDLGAFLIDSLTPRSISYHSSIGCPFRCNFCTVTEIYEQRWSGFTPERVLRDIKHLVAKTGAYSVEFYDNNFFVNDERTFGIARHFVDEKLDILWSAEARPDKIAEFDDEMLLLLKRSGLKWVFIGAESGHDDVLKLMERDHSADATLQAAERLAKFNIKVTFSFNIGYPGEPADNFDKTERLAKELRRLNRETELMVYITTAYDATPAFHKAAEFNSRKTDDLDQWSHLDQRSGEGKSWLTPRYGRKLYNYSLVTFYATSFLHNKLSARHRKNLFLYLLHCLAWAHHRFSWYRSILDLRILNRLFSISAAGGKRSKMDMWTGRE